MKIKIKFEPRDAWIGVFIDVEENWFTSKAEMDSKYSFLKFYVCIIPFFPIIISIDIGYSTHAKLRKIFIGK